MKKLIIVLFLSAIPAFCQFTVCPTPGGTGTMDGGLVSYSCAPNVFTTACQATVLGNYASTVWLSLAAEPTPCFDVYWNTADGVNNTNPVIISMPEGGMLSTGGPVVGSQNRQDWTDGWPSANGTTASISNMLVDGTCPGCNGKHYNLVGLGFSLGALSSVTNNTSSGVSSIVIDGQAGGGHYWPQGTTPPYYIYIGADQQEYTVTSQTGTYTSCITGGGSGCYTLGISPPLASNPSSGDPVWAVDASQKGAPGNGPSFYLGGVCDYLQALSYMTTNAGSGFPGNGHFILSGISGTATGPPNILMFGKNMATLAIASGGCGFSSYNSSWVIDGSFWNSPMTDGGAELAYRLLSNAQVAPCSSVSVTGNNTAFILGPWAYTPANNSGNYALTSFSPSIYTHQGLQAVGGNTLFNAARSVTAQGCVIGTATPAQCFFQMDAYLGKQMVETGSIDASNPCSIQVSYGLTTPGTQLRVQAGVNHAANFNTTAAGGVPGTCNNLFIACANSIVFQDFFLWLANLYNHANITQSGVIGAGLH